MSAAIEPVILKPNDFWNYIVTNYLYSKGKGNVIEIHDQFITGKDQPAWLAALLKDYTQQYDGELVFLDGKIVANDCRAAKGRGVAHFKKFEKEIESQVHKREPLILVNASYISMCPVLAKAIPARIRESNCSTLVCSVKELQEIEELKVFSNLVSERLEANYEKEKKSGQILAYRNDKRGKMSQKETSSDYSHIGEGDNNHNAEVLRVLKEIRDTDASIAQDANKPVNIKALAIASSVASVTISIPVIAAVLYIFSQYVDKEINEVVEPYKSDVTRLDTSSNGYNDSIIELKKDMSTVKVNVKQLLVDSKNNGESALVLNGKVVNIESDINEIKTDIKEVRDGVNQLLIGNSDTLANGTH